VQGAASLEAHAQIALLNVNLVLRACTVHLQVPGAIIALLVLFKVDTERMDAINAH